MDSPYNRNFGWYQQPGPTRRPFTHSTSYGGVPTNPPKVVQIPVHFMPVDRSGFALKIQKVSRGFLVRKNMKRIKDVKKQVDEIGDKLSRSEMLDSIRSNEKERLRISETLMSLLFKLDSIRGVDLGVRDCRKSVIRKAIALQEKIDDAIVATDLENDAETETTKDREPEIEVSVGTGGSNQSDSQGNAEHIDVNLDESRQKLEVVSNIGGDEVNVEENESVVDVGVDCAVKVSEGISCAKMCVDSAEENMIENDGKNSFGKYVEEEMLTENDGKNSVGKCSAMKEKEGDENGDDNKRSRKLLEKMAEENEKMMSMMTRFFERNEKQMSMLTALTHRVKHLEKAFLCDKMSRKKAKKMKKYHTV